MQPNVHILHLLKFVHTGKDIHGKQVYMADGKNEIINFVVDILYNTKQKDYKHGNKR
jgi:hypothetical protein